MEITKTTTVLDVAREARIQSEKEAETKAAAIAKETAEKAAAEIAVAAAAKAAGTKAEGAYAFKAIAVDDHGVIVGIGAVAGNVDLDNETLVQKGLVQMSYDFCGSATRTLKANHGEPMLKAELVSSWPGAPILKSGKVLAAGDAVPENDPVVGINIEKGKETHWFVGIRPNDDAVLKAAKEGGVAGFSWGAHVVKTPVTA